MGQSHTKELVPTSMTLNSSLLSPGLVRIERLEGLAQEKTNPSWQDVMNPPLQKIKDVKRS